MKTLADRRCRPCEGGAKPLKPEQGAELIRTQVGDRYVVDEMRRGGYVLGGEQSGHVIFLEHNTTGDGLLTALQVLAIMKRKGRPLSELADCMERTLGHPACEITSGETGAMHYKISNDGTGRTAGSKLLIQALLCALKLRLDGTNGLTEALPEDEIVRKLGFSEAEELLCHLKWRWQLGCVPPRR